MVSLMIRTSNIRSLSEFQRNAKRHIRRLKKTGRPEVLTVNGRSLWCRCRGVSEAAG